MMEVKLEEDENGDLIMPIPDSLMDDLGWNIGDTLIWSIVEGRITLSKQQGETDGDTTGNVS